MKVVKVKSNGFSGYPVGLTDLEKKEKSEKDRQTAAEKKKKQAKILLEKWRVKEDFAKGLRATPTPSEKRLFDALTERGEKFEFQKVVHGYIPDFVFGKKIVEVDGGIHKKRREEDAIRDAHLRKRGYKIIRVTDKAVMKHLDKVLEQIDQFLGRKPVQDKYEDRDFLHSWTTADGTYTLHFKPVRMGEMRSTVAWEQTLERMSLVERQEDDEFDLDAQFDFLTEGI